MYDRYFEIVGELADVFAQIDFQLFSSHESVDHTSTGQSMH